MKTTVKHMLVRHGLSGNSLIPHGYLSFDQIAKKRDCPQTPNGHAAQLIPKTITFWEVRG